MFYGDDDNRYELNGELFQVVHHEIYTITSNLNITPFHARTIPTHTEDGIPIRKLYVSNLPAKTTRTELFNVFVQYGFIKSCWLRMGDRGPHRSPTATYAFVTFSNPADAHKALLAPSHEKMLRGRTLRLSPADSWHQPCEDADGKVRWKAQPKYSRVDRPSLPSNASGLELIAESSRHNTSENNIEDNTSSVEGNAESTSEDSVCYNIIDILNRDCLTHILSYVPLMDLLRTERVSKSWQNMVQDYFEGIRVFKTSWWRNEPIRLTTAVLRRVLHRLGPSLTRLYIDHQLSALNDRTAHTIGKFCPNLELLKIVGMHTKNWNPLIYGCKKLRTLSFISCNRLTDSSLVHLVKNDSTVEDLTVANNTHVTGLFLTGSSTVRLKSLSFHNCYSLQGTVLCAAIDTLPNLTTLKLDQCPMALWKIVPLILRRVPQLLELSLSDYTSSGELYLLPPNLETFCESLSYLTELKTLNLFRNIHINDQVLKQVSQSCTKLENLNISSCNATRNNIIVNIGGVPSEFEGAPGVGDEGLRAVCASCRQLRTLDVSYLSAVGDAGVRAVAGLPRLARLVTRGNPSLTSEPLGQCLRACRQLQEVDACGSDNVSDQLIVEALESLKDNPRKVTLWLANTAAAGTDPQIHPKNELLTVNLIDDRSNPNLRPDFVDVTLGYNSEDSFDDLYDHDLYDDFGDDFLDPVEDLFLGQDDDDINEIYAFGLHPNVMML